MLGLEDAQQRLLSSDNRDCNAIDCGGTVAHELDVDVSVLVTVWTRDGLPTSVVVTFIDQQGESIAGDAQVETTFEVAVDAALTLALTRLRANRTGTLRVTTDPTGAAVRIDGREVGRAPLERLLPVGEHRVDARLDDMTAEGTAEIVAHDTTELALTLEAAAQPPPPPPPGLNPLVPVGIGLIVAGVATRGDPGGGELRERGLPRRDDVRLLRSHGRLGLGVGVGRDRRCGGAHRCGVADHRSHRQPGISGGPRWSVPDVERRTVLMMRGAANLIPVSLAMAFFFGCNEPVECPSSPTHPECQPWLCCADPTVAGCDPADIAMYCGDSGMVDSGTDGDTGEVDTGVCPPCSGTTPQLRHDERSVRRVSQRRSLRAGFL